MSNDRTNTTNGTSESEQGMRVENGEISFLDDYGDDASVSVNQFGKLWMECRQDGEIVELILNQPQAGQLAPIIAHYAATGKLENPPAAGALDRETLGREFYRVCDINATALGRGFFPPFAFPPFDSQLQHVREAYTKAAESFAAYVRSQTPEPVQPTDTDDIWPIVNRRRGALIDKDVAGTISENERKELARLQKYADMHVADVAPRAPEVLEGVLRAAGIDITISPEQPEAVELDRANERTIPFLDECGEACKIVLAKTSMEFTSFVGSEVLEANAVLNRSQHGPIIKAMYDWLIEGQAESGPQPAGVVEAGVVEALRELVDKIEYWHDPEPCGVAGCSCSECEIGNSLKQAKAALSALPSAGGEGKMTYEQLDIANGHLSDMVTERTAERDALRAQLAELQALDSCKLRGEVVTLEGERDAVKYSLDLLKKQLGSTIGELNVAWADRDALRREVDRLNIENRELCISTGKRIEAIEAERDQLRAEVERLLELNKNLDSWFKGQSSTRCKLEDDRDQAIALLNDESKERHELRQKYVASLGIINAINQASTKAAAYLAEIEATVKDFCKQATSVDLDRDWLGREFYSVLASEHATKWADLDDESRNHSSELGTTFARAILARYATAPSVPQEPKQSTSDLGWYVKEKYGDAFLYHNDFRIATFHGASIERHRDLAEKAMNYAMMARDFMNDAFGDPTPPDPRRVVEGMRVRFTTLSKGTVNGTVYRLYITEQQSKTIVPLGEWGVKDDGGTMYSFNARDGLLPSGYDPLPAEPVEAKVEEKCSLCRHKPTLYNASICGDCFVKIRESHGLPTPPIPEPAGDAIVLPEAVKTTSGDVSHVWPDGAKIRTYSHNYPGEWFAYKPDGNYADAERRKFPTREAAAAALRAIGQGPGAKNCESTQSAIPGISPAEYLRDEIKSRGWSNEKFAEKLGASPAFTANLLAGKEHIGDFKAKVIAKALGTSPDVWLNLQAAWDAKQEVSRPDETRPCPKCGTPFDSHAPMCPKCYWQEQIDAVPKEMSITKLEIKILRREFEIFREIVTCAIETLVATIPGFRNGVQQVHRKYYGGSIDDHIGCFAHEDTKRSSQPASNDGPQEPGQEQMDAMPETQPAPPPFDVEIWIGAIAKGMTAYEEFGGYDEGEEAARNAIRSALAEKGE